MLSKLKIQIEGKNIGYNLGSIFHGALMEMLSKETAIFLHEQAYNPYSQHIEKDGENIYWIISGLNKFAHENIIEKILEKNEIYIRHKDLQVKFLNKELYNISREEFISKNLFSISNKNKILFDIATPISFKSQGMYINYPQIRLVFQNILKKFDASGEEKLFDEELLNNLVEISYITKYRLQSKLFYVENTKIPAFTGNFELGLKGPKELINIANLLQKFAYYSGMGIKTSMGMGGIRSEQ